MQTLNKSSQWNHLMRPTDRLFHTLILFLILSLLLPTSGAGAQTLVIANSTGAGSDLTATASPTIPYDRLIDLETLGGPNSHAVAINNAGQVIGNSDTSDMHTHAILWELASGNIVKTDIETLGGRDSSAVAMNEAGRVIGRSYLENNRDNHAFLWEKGKKPIDLGTLGGTVSYPVAINEASQVIGVSYLANLTLSHAVLWEGGSPPIDLTPHSSVSYPVAINESGQVIGAFWTANGYHAFLWKGGDPIDLTPVGAIRSSPVGINDDGQIVVNVDFRVNNVAYSHPVLWDHGNPIDLKTLGGDHGTAVYSRAVAINQAGKVIGISDLAWDTPDEHTVLWDRDHADPIDLKTLGGTVSSPVAINEDGWVIGESTKYASDQKKSGFVWHGGAMMGLGDLGCGSSTAVAINNKTDLVIGNSCFYANANQLAFVWQDTAMTSMTYLGTLGGANTTTSEAVAINDSGWVIGDSRLADHTSHAFLSIPRRNTYIDIGETMERSYYVKRPYFFSDSYAGANNGPLRVSNTQSTTMMAENTQSAPMIADEQVIYRINGTYASFSEMMGLPAGQMDTTYWMPWYNNVDLDTQLRFANVSDTEATVHIYIGTQEMRGSPFTLAPGVSTRQSFVGINNGPVKIESNVKIVPTERVIYKVNGAPTSFSEMMGLPNKQLDKVYWMPWYNNVDLDTQLRFANASSSTATVHVYIGGTEMTGSPFTLPAGTSFRRSFPGVNTGPVKIASDFPIVATERVIYKVNGVPTSFSEMMGLPNSQLDTTYWMPSQSGGPFDAQLRFANVSDQPATVHLYLGQLELGDSPVTLAPGASIRRSYTIGYGGWVKFVSDFPIVVSERVISQEFVYGGVKTGFSEMMGLPNNQIDTIYWFPWYNNVDLNTKLWLGIP